MILENSYGYPEENIMKNYKILFTKPETAELVEEELVPEVSGDHALVRTLYTAVSAGTERDNLRDEPNLYCVQGMEAPPFPRHFGYSGVAVVLKAGPDCTRVREGQRVVVYFGSHSRYNILPESKLFPLAYDDIPSDVAALSVIAGFPAEGVRKTRLEFGESALVMGLGILGLISVQLCKAAGAVPVIAADPHEERRKLAIQLGADYVLNPRQEGFTEQVRKLTGGKGVNVAVDSAGKAMATTQALECLAQFGRVTLLGCTRHPGEYDLYHLVHGKGASVIGANNLARPQLESRPGNWTGFDDNAAIQKLLHYKRIDMKPLISEVHAPAEAPAVYDRLVHERTFPIGVLFDWERIPAEEEK